MDPDQARQGSEETTVDVMAHDAESKRHAGERRGVNRLGWPMEMSGVLSNV
jgi:hypothetical protein